MPMVGLTNAEGEKLKSISNDALREETLKLQEFINQELKGIDDQLAALHQRIADQPDLDITEKENVFIEIDKIEESRNKELEKF